MAILPESKKYNPVPEYQSRDYDRIIEHACRELKLTRKQIAMRFQIAENFIGPEQISTLWKEYLTRKGK